MERYLTTEDVMKIFKVSKQAVSQWVEKGLLKAYKLGRRTTRYRKKDVEDFARRRANRPTLPFNSMSKRFDMPKQKSNTIRYHDFF